MTLSFHGYIGHSKPSYTKKKKKLLLCFCFSHNNKERMSQGIEGNSVMWLEQ